MVIGILKIQMHLGEGHSLKEKRKVVKSIVGKVRSRFNAAIAEVGENDKWQLIELGLAAVGNDKRHIDSSLSNILDFIDSLYLAEIVETKMELINV